MTAQRTASLQSNWLRRRQFFGALGHRSLLVTAALMPMVRMATAQVPKRRPRLGVLRPYVAKDRFYPAFVEALRARGYIEGDTLDILYRQVQDADFERAALELVRVPVDVIFAPNPAQAQASRRATSKIPIVVAAVGDVVSTGLAQSLAHPGLNVTGLTANGSDLGGKRLDILKQLVPDLQRVAVLWNPGVPDKREEWQQMRPTAKALGLELLSFEVRTHDDFAGAFSGISAANVRALLALGEPLVYTQRGRIIDYAARERLPALFNWREAVEEGALICYGPNIADLYRRAAGYVGRILKGESPADLPIEEPTKFDFVVNLKTARAIGLTIPPLFQADETIE